MTLPGRWRWARAAVAAPLVLALAGTIALAEHPEIAKRRAAERKTFTDSEIVDGFLKLTLSSEFQVTGRSDRIRKFDGPVRVFIDNRAKPDRRRQIAATVADIKHRVQNLDIAITETREDANTIVTLVRDRDLAQTILSIYGRERARSIQKSLEPQCL